MNINSLIAKTYIVSNKKLTAVAVLGVLLGMSIYIFMNSMMVGFDKSSSTSVFKSTAHIRVYKDDEISKALIKQNDSKALIINPKVVPVNNTIINPNLVIETILKQKEVVVRRFGLLGYEISTLEEVGNEIGLTRERVRQIQVDALRRLREIFKQEGLSDEMLLHDK